MSIGQRLKEARKSRRISQDILAEKLAEGILASGLFQEEQPESDF